MSRGFDGFEIDDFRDSDSGWGRDADRDRSSDWNNRLALHNIHREEGRSTLDVYAQALTPAKRAAHLKVVELIRTAAGTGCVPVCSHGEEADSVSA